MLLANDGTIVGLFDALVEFIYHSQADEETVQRCRTIRSAWASSGQDYCDFWRRIPEYERKMALSATLLLAESLQEERRLEPFFLRVRITIFYSPATLPFGPLTWTCRRSKGWQRSTETSSLVLSRQTQCAQKRQMR